MNYIAEINAFYIWLETNELSNPAINLWHALMHIANRTGWQDKFTVAVSTLEAKTRLNKKAVERARNNLQQMGRIEWKERKGNQSAFYKIISLCDKIDIENVSQSVSQSVLQDVSQPVPQSVPINKQNNTKPNETKESSGASAPVDDPVPEKTIRHKHGEYGWVLLSDDEYSKLVSDHGIGAVGYYISYIDESAQSTGNKNKWKDWNLTIRKAIRDKWGKYAPVEASVKTGQSRKSFSEIAEENEKERQGII